LYEVAIRHRRRAPVEHSFRYGSYMWLFDLERPPRGFRSSDHLDVRAELASAGIHPSRVVVLANTRVLGYVFNPLTLYWCYDSAGVLLARVAEVHNTYGDRHAYVMSADGGREAVVSKEMTVSPFHPAGGTYRIRIGDPGETLAVSVTLERQGEEPFGASLSGRRLDATWANRVRTHIRYPAAPLRGRVLIQLQGLRLWRRGLEVQPR
jgi:hypothetical protein